MRMKERSEIMNQAKVVNYQQPMQQFMTQMPQMLNQPPPPSQMMSVMNRSYKMWPQSQPMNPVMEPLAFQNPFNAGKPPGLWRSNRTKVIVQVSLIIGSSGAQLCPTFYASSCPNVSAVVRSVIEDAIPRDHRAGAKLVRLHYHDCFVNGCDASVLLDNADGIESEKDANINAVTLTGYNHVDAIKTAIENVCPGVVSCADILALGAEAAVSLAGGPSWDVMLGRRDGLTANRSGADSNLPDASDPLDVIKTKFANLGLDSTEMVALSGIHTFGNARCITIKDRLYNFSGIGEPDSTLDTTYMETLRQSCPQSGAANNIFNLDPTTPTQFDNAYYGNLLNNRGLLPSDQELFSTTASDTVSAVSEFANNQSQFFDSFVKSMLKMGNISPLTRTNGQVRLNCARVNA